MIVGVKLPGAGMISANEASTNGLPSALSYRQFSINADAVHRVCQALADAAKRNLVIAAVGGIGSHLYMNFARDCGLSPREVRSIGCRQVELLVSILERKFKRDLHTTEVRRVTLGNLEQVAAKMESGICLLRPTLLAQSTDSLCVDACIRSNATHVVFLKTQVPTYYAGFSVPTTLREWAYDDMAERARAFEMNSGGNYVLDSQAIELLSRSSIDAYLLNPEDVQFICDPKSAPRGTRLVRSQEQRHAGRR